MRDLDGGLIAGYYIRDMSYVFNEKPGSGSRSWLSICSNSLGDRLAAVDYYSSQIYTSSNYGETWVARDSVRYWWSICSNSVGDRLAAVEYGGQIYTSSNYGKTWVARDSGRYWWSICSNSVGDRLAAVMFGGQIYTSSNYGETWTPRDSGRYWYSICSNSVGDRLAAVEYYGGQIYTSSNYGETWVARDSGRDWQSICSNLNGDRLAAVVNNGLIYTSNNYGETWIARTSTTRDWRSICSSSAGDKLAAVIYDGYIYTASVYYTYKGTILEDMLATGTSTTLTGYQINGTAPKFLTAFYKGTDKDAVTDLSANMGMFKYLGNQIEFCPAYTLHDVSGTGFTIPSNITKMFVVCIGGGGGGGGGGVRGSGSVGGSAGGGGGGALNAWFVTFVSDQTTYNVTIGEGGLYGQPNNGTGIAEGAEDRSGGQSNLSQGRDGAPGGDTTFTYNSLNYISKGGKDGHGGKGGQTAEANGDGFGGNGGVVSTTPIPVYASNAGANGENGGFGVNGDVGTTDEPGGVGGASGNKRGTNTRFLINNSYINVQPFPPYTAPSDYSGASSTYNADRICYGDGGRGGRAEGASANDWGFAGYSGLKGCVIVFFYY